MQAVIINQTGGVEVMKLVQDHPMPTRKPGQVRHSRLQPFIHTGSGSSLLWELYDTCLTLPRPCMHGALHGAAAWCRQLQSNSMQSMWQCTVLDAVCTASEGRQQLLHPEQPAWLMTLDALCWCCWFLSVCRCWSAFTAQL